MSILRTGTADAVWTAGVKRLSQVPIVVNSETGRQAANQVGAVLKKEGGGRTWVLTRGRSTVKYIVPLQVRPYVALRLDGRALVRRLAGPFGYWWTEEGGLALKAEFGEAVRSRVTERAQEAALQERLIRFPLPARALVADEHNPWTFAHVENLIITESEARALGPYVEEISRTFGPVS